MFEEVKTGSLFESEAEALVNPVNTEGVMGAGLAREFRNRYPDMYREYQRICARGMLDVGTMHFWLTGSKEPQFIVNFPTKRSWRQPSQLEWIERGLDELKRHLLLRSITSVAIPALGCGHGGLAWAPVRRQIHHRFASTDKIQVWAYAPQTARRPVRT